MKKFALIIILYSLFQTVAFSKGFLGTFSTVSESECNIEITFLKDGSGTFIETCRREDGSHIDDVEKYEFIWSELYDQILIKIKGSEEFFTYERKLACSPFGEKGASNGLVGYGTKFWRTPIKCK